MRVGVDPRQSPLQLPDRRFAQHMLDLFGVVVDVIGRDLGGVGQVELPQPVIPDDRAARCHPEGVNAIRSPESVA